MSEFELVELCSVADSQEASLIHAKLGDAGISCRIVGDMLQGAAGGLPLGHATTPRIWVRDVDVHRALEVLESVSTVSLPDDIDVPAPLESPVPDTTPVADGLNWRVAVVATSLAAMCLGVIVWLVCFAEPTTGVGFYNRAVSKYRRGLLEDAIRDFSSAIMFDAEDPYFYGGRADAYFAAGEYEKATRDYDHAIRLNPGSARDHYWRAYCWYHRGKHSKAIADCRVALTRDESDADAHNLLAWLLANCPEKELRNGPEAVSHARRSCELSNWKSWYAFDMLAAAYAESGNFDEAVKWQHKAIDSAPAEEKESCREALNRYLTGQPTRDTRIDLGNW